MCRRSELYDTECVCFMYVCDLLHMMEKSCTEIEINLPLFPASNVDRLFHGVLPPSDTLQCLCGGLLCEHSPPAVCSCVDPPLHSVCMLTSTLTLHSITVPWMLCCMHQPPTPTQPPPTISLAPPIPGMLVHIFSSKDGQQQLL